MLESLDGVDARRAERFAVRSVLGLAAVILGGTLFVLLLAAVVTGWAPLRALDQGITDAFNDLVADVPLLLTALQLLTELGGAWSIG
jgi:hypothetical protein